MMWASNRAHLYLSVFIINIVLLACGTTFVWSSPVLGKLGLTDTEGSIVSSMLSLGSILGPFVSRAILDVLGRKVTLGLGMCVLTLSWLILTASNGCIVLAVGRFLAGVMVGMVGSVSSVYVAEISEDSVRGVLNTMGQIPINLGCLLVYAIGPFVSYSVLNYVMLGVCVIFFVLLPFLPESPYYLVMRDDITGATETIVWLRGNPSASTVVKELNDIQKTVKQNEDVKGTLKDLFTSQDSRRALFICCGLMTFMQLSGISVLCSYTEPIFEMTRTELSSSTCSIAFGIIMLATSILSPIAVKYLGYKKPLFISILGMAVGMGTLGSFFLLKGNRYEVSSIYWLPLSSLIVYIAFFNVGFSTIPWAISGELFNNKVKSEATAIVSSICGIFGFLSTQFYSSLIAIVGNGIVFLGCSLFCCLGAIFVTLFVQDTCSLSFADIQELLKSNSKKEVPNKAKHNCEDQICQR